MQIYDGRDNRLEVDERQLRIVPMGSQHPSDDVRLEVPLSAITGAGFRPAGLLRPGQLQVIAVGVPRSAPGASDRATVVFTRAQASLFTALYGWLQQIAEHNHRTGVLPAVPARTTSPTPSAATPPATTPPSAAPTATARPAPRRRPGRARPLPGGFHRVQLTRSRTQHYSAAAVFTAIDLETTGLDPAQDRIIEVGLVKFTADGQVLDEFTTLVNNPGSSREARDVHHVDDVDLVDAPHLGEVLAEVLTFVEGTILVGHKMDFEESFLRAAARAHHVPLPPLQTLCTLQTAYRQLEGRAFSLTAMHKTATGAFASDAHTALGDARATRHVLLWLLHQAPSPLHLTAAPPTPSTAAPTTAGCAISCRPVPTVQASLAGLLASFPQSPIPRAGDSRALTAYQQLLQDSVEDGRLTYEEADSLTKAARRTRVTGTQLRELHQSAWRSAFPGDVDADWTKLSPTRRREMFLLADALALPDIAGRLRQVIDALAEPSPPATTRLFARCGNGPPTTAPGSRSTSPRPLPGWQPAPPTQATDNIPRPAISVCPSSVSSKRQRA